MNLSLECSRDITGRCGMRAESTIVDASMTLHIAGCGWWINGLAGILPDIISSLFYFIRVIRQVTH